MLNFPARTEIVYKTNFNGINYRKTWNKPGAQMDKKKKFLSSGHSDLSLQTALRWLSCRKKVQTSIFKLMGMYKRN